MDPNKLNFKFLDHTADLGIIVSGLDLKDLFKTAAKSMIKIIVKGKPAGKTNTVKLKLNKIAEILREWQNESKCGTVTFRFEQRTNKLIIYCGRVGYMIGRQGVTIDKYRNKINELHWHGKDIGIEFVETSFFEV